MRCFLVALVTLYLTPLFSQSAGYYALVDTQQVWSMVGSLTAYGADVFRMRVSRDSTVYNAKWYRNLRIWRLKEDDNYRSSPYYLREAERKVYFLDATPDRGGNIGEEVLLYDFSLEVGDTLLIPPLFNTPDEYSLYVSETDSVDLADGSRRRRWKLLCKPGPGNDPLEGTGQDWIEGIGATRGFLEPAFACAADAAPGYLLCVASADDVIFRNEVECEDYTVDVPVRPYVELRLSVYPNPTSKALWLEAWAEGLPYRVYDPLGRSVAVGKVAQSRINLPYLAGGTYTLHIRDAGGRGHAARFQVLH